MTPTNNQNFVDQELPVPQGNGQSPGFWKNYLDLFDQELAGITPWAASESLYEDLFGVALLFDGATGKYPADPTLADALKAKGGGEGQLLRHTAAALATAASDDADFFYGFHIPPGDDRDVLEFIDLDNDKFISVEELINAVQDVYTEGDTALGTDFFDFVGGTEGDVGDVADAIEAMNNMPHLDPDYFIP